MALFNKRIFHCLIFNVGGCRKWRPKRHGETWYERQAKLRKVAKDDQEVLELVTQIFMEVVK